MFRTSAKPGDASKVTLDLGHSGEGEKVEVAPQAHSFTPKKSLSGQNPYKTRSICSVWAILI